MFISKFSISGYRSLKDVKINNILPVCIFHGENNTGKSNILSALEVIFQRKVEIEETEAVAETGVYESSVGFWRGKIKPFRDNFFMNKGKDIKFSVTVTFDDSELNFLRGELRQIQDRLASPEYVKKLSLEGRIKYVDDDTAEIILDKASMNRQSNIVYTNGEKTQIFPKATTLEPGEKFAKFEKLMDILSDSFTVFPSDRYLTVEKDAGEPIGNAPFTPRTFKNWLSDLSTSRTGHKNFKLICQMFETSPFSFGEISFVKERGEIEIMVEKDGPRLPISRVGSGLQQILYIMAAIIRNRGKMVGIEELEINLSPETQKKVFGKLKSFVSGGSGIVSQVLVTSHSNYFGGRDDVRRYGVTHNGEYTTVKRWKTTTIRNFFR